MPYSRNSALYHYQAGWTIYLTCWVVGIEWDSDDIWLAIGPFIYTIKRKK